MPLVDGVCVGGEGCCPYGGFALDADAGCLSAKLTVLGCVRHFEPAGTNAECACAASQSCLAARRDGGNDGSVYWRRDGCLYDPAKFVDCSPDVEGQAYMASTRPACR